MTSKPHEMAIKPSAAVLYHEWPWSLTQHPDKTEVCEDVRFTGLQCVNCITSNGFYYSVPPPKNLPVDRYLYFGLVVWMNICIVLIVHWMRFYLYGAFSKRYFPTLHSVSSQSTMTLSWMKHWRGIHERSDIKTFLFIFLSFFHTWLKFSVSLN